MTAETLKLALQLLKEHKTLTLATYADGRPWAASLYFVSDTDLKLYFVSDPDTRHVSPTDSKEQPIANTYTCE